MLIILVFPAGAEKTFTRAGGAIQKAGFTQRLLVYCLAFTGNDTPPFLSHSHEIYLKLFTTFTVSKNSRKRKIWRQIAAFSQPFSKTKHYVFSGLFLCRNTAAKLWDMTRIRY